MRGIAGTIGLDAGPEDISLVARMLESCSPNSGSPHLSGGTVLGPDPVYLPDRSVGLVWDGHITNAGSLRHELTGAGFRFHTNNIAEILLIALRSWGAEGLAKRLQGAFVIAAFDAPRKRVTLIRDRLGLRRLAYTIQDGKLRFCSSVRGLRLTWSGAGLARDLDPAALVDFLDLGWVPDERAIYRGIAKVPAATVIEIDPQGERRTVYWQSPQAIPSCHVSFPHIVAITQELFLEAVRTRLETHSSVAALLGTGIESSLLGWALVKLDARIPVYRIASAGEDALETEAALNLSRKLGLRTEVLFVNERDEPHVGDLAAVYDEPYAAPAAFQMLRIGQLAHRQAGVFLTGDGVDWPFLGSPRHRRCWQMERLLGDLDFDEVALARHAQSLLGLPRAYLQPGGAARHLFGSRLRVWQQKHPAPRLDGDGATILSDYLAFDRVATFARDRAGMNGAALHFGVETRSPFLDDNLWNFVTQVPFNLRLRGGESRAILRELARQHVSQTFAQREKPDAGADLRRLLATHWQTPLVEILRDSYLVSEGWIDGAALQREADVARRRGQASRGLWHFFVLEYWLRRAAMQPLSKSALAATIAKALAATAGV
jgi:asparagine synthase (glutamine-hydrolysing)